MTERIRKTLENLIFCLTILVFLPIISFKRVLNEGWVSSQGSPQEAPDDQPRENRNHLCSLLVLTLLLVATGCKSGPEPVAEPIPGWLKSIPKDETHYYAIGVSGPTPRVTDAWDQAIRRARAELGRVIISHISSQDTIISTSSGQYVREIVKILSDAELNYTEVVERWADRRGVYGPPEHFYVLVRIEKGRAKSVLRSIN